MITAQDPEFRPELLSVREREVVDLAIDGRTDEQIAQTLEISTSTVNSYWVRIRGKLGFMNRTEMVSKMIHFGYKNTHAGLLAQIEQLSGSLAAADTSLAQSKRDLEAERGASWHLLALHFVPEAVVVAKAPGDVVYANLQAEKLFHADPGALVGQAAYKLTVPEGRPDKRERIREFMEAEIPGRMIMGIDEPSYALGHHGGNFRVTISVEGFEAPEGFMGVFTIREFLGDMDAVIRSLRKPLILV